MHGGSDDYESKLISYFAIIFIFRFICLILHVANSLRRAFLMAEALNLLKRIKIFDFVFLQY